MIYRTIIIIVLPLIVFITLYYMKVPSVAEGSLPKPIYNKDMLNQSQPNVKTLTFRDVTLESGITRIHSQRSETLSGLHESLGAGACAFDANNDGWVDLLTLNGSGTTHFFGKPKWWQQNKNSLTLYQNNHDGTFKNITKESLLLTQAWTMGCGTGDIDNDGNVDIFITSIGSNQLWRNNGDGTFSNKTHSSGITGDDWSTSVSLIDYNRDGFLDIYINNYIDYESNSLTFETSSGFENEIKPNFNPALFNGQENQLFINQGDWTFKEIANSIGINNQQGRSLFSYWSDLNGDGYQDAIITNDKDSPNKVFLNQREKIVKDISFESRLGFIDRTSSLGAADFDNDGNDELFITTDHTLFPRIYSTKNDRQENDISYVDKADKYLISNVTAINQAHQGMALEDFNLDGKTDIFIANGLTTTNLNSPLIAQGQKNTLLINNNHNYFINFSEVIAPNTYSQDASRCAISADFDNNGTPDIYVSNNNDLGQLLFNTTENHNWVGIRLNAINTLKKGAIVIVDSGNSDIIQREYGKNNTFLCNGDERLLFGLNTSAAEESITITVKWPDNEVQIFSDIKNGAYYTINKKNNSIEKDPYYSSKQLSRIRISNWKYKIQVINWLIKNNKIQVAAKELSILLKSKNKNARLLALKSIEKLPNIHQIPLIQIAATDLDPDVEKASIRLIKINEDERLTRWLLKKLFSENHLIACEAAKTLGYFFDEEEALIIGKRSSISPLIRLATTENTKTDNSKARQCAIEALGKSENYRALKPLIALTQTNNNRIRYSSINALGLLKEKEALTILKGISMSAENSVKNRSAAIFSIKKISPQFRIEELAKKITKDDSGWPSTLNNIYFNENSNPAIRLEISNLLNFNIGNIVNSGKEYDPNLTDCQISLNKTKHTISVDKKTSLNEIENYFFLLNEYIIK